MAYNRQRTVVGTDDFGRDEVNTPSESYPTYWDRGARVTEIGQRGTARTRTVREVLLFGGEHISQRCASDLVSGLGSEGELSALASGGWSPSSIGKYVHASLVMYSKVCSGSQQILDLLVLGKPGG